MSDGFGLAAAGVAGGPVLVAGRVPAAKGPWRAALERVGTVQLRDGSVYTNARTLVPVVVMAGVWLLVNLGAAGDVRGLMNRSVGIRHLLVAVGLATLWNVWLTLSGYSAERGMAAELKRVAWASVACGALPLGENLARGLYGQGFLLGELTTAGLLLVSYALLGVFVAGAMVLPRLGRRRMALVVGSGRRAEMMKDALLQESGRLEIFGCVDDEYFGDDEAGDNFLGPISGLADLLKRYPIEVVLIGLPVKSKYDEIQRVIDVCEATGVESHTMQEAFRRTRPRLVRRGDAVGVETQTLGRLVKRGIDLVGGAALVVVFAPVMMAAALAVRLTSAGPVLFVQKRYGCNRRLFPMFKFRSMVVDAEARQAGLESANEAAGPVFKLKRDPRVTRVGAFLRRTSIDELPQLFNVLRGEMSLVGPRPLPTRDVSRFEEAWLLRRFSVRPGLTCLWQVKGRSDTSFDQWIKLDLEYIDGWSLGLDAKILMMTVPAVLRGSGAV